MKDTVAASYISDAEENETHQAKIKSNLEKYGYSTWYDFCVVEWGTKWDIGDAGGIADYSQNELNVVFDSAWSAPIEAYSKLMDLGFEVDAYYYESGMGFCGRWENGSDSYYDIPETSDMVEKVIPADIDEMFLISENMADWESQDA